MKISCCCGIIVGFLLALLLGGGVCYFFYCRENPEAAERGMEHIESGWEKTKSAGDEAIRELRPKVVPAKKSDD